MKVRIIQRVYMQDKILDPGDVVDVDAELAQKWIEQERAIVWEDEAEKPAKKKVSNGNR